MAAPWEKYGGTTVAPAPPGPVVVGMPRAKDPAPRHPEQAEKDRLDAVNAGLKPADQRFQNETELRQNYAKSLPVVSYQQVIAPYISAIRAADNTAGDLDIVYAFGKIMDPGSVVREGEMDMVTGTGPVAERVKGYLASIQGNGGRLTPAIRRELLGELRNRALVASDAYNQTRQDYKRLAARYGFDPDAIVGSHVGVRFQQAEADYLGRPIKNEDGTIGAEPRSTDPRGNVGDVGFSGLEEDPLPGGGMSPERQREWDNSIRQLQTAFEQGATEDQLVAQARDLRIPIDKRFMDNLRGVLSEREKGNVVPFVRDPFSAPVDISDARSPDEGGNPLGMTGAFLTPQNVDAFVRGAADIPTLGMADKIAAAGDTIFFGGTMDENLARQRGITDYDKENNFGPRVAGQAAGALAIPTRIPQAALGAGRAALRGGMGRAEAIIAAQRAGTRRMAGEGAAFGGGYGFGSTEGGIDDRLIGAGSNALLGGLSGYGLGRIGSALGGTNPLPAAQRNALTPDVEAAQAANALGIDMPRFVAGGPSAQNWGRRMEQSPLGRAPISGAVDTMIDQSRAARDRIAGDVGSVVSPEEAAEVARRGAARFNRASRANVRGLYRRAETAAQGVDVTPQSTMQTLTGLIREEAAVPGGTEALPILRHYAQAFEGGGPISIQGARKMRSTLRSRLRTEGNLTSSDADRITQIVMGAVGDDIAASLTRAGRQAAIPAYREADRAHAERLTLADDILAPFIGKDGDKWGAEVAQAIARDAKGNGERLAQFLGTMHPEDANTVRASLISQLGRTRSGGQNAAGEAFSLDEFLTNWDAIRGARERIFDRQTRRDLNSLAQVAERAKATNRTRGHSNTGADVWAVAGTVLPSGVGIGGAAAGSPMTLAAGMLATAGIALAQYGGARLLASPGFARRLAQTPTNPRAASRYWSSPWVAQMARSNPSIASELTGFQQAIIRAANDNVGQVQRMAASPLDNEENSQNKR